MKISIRLNHKKIMIILIIVNSVLVLFSLIGQYSTYYLNDGHLHGFVPQFNLDREMNIPTWVSAFMMLFIAFLLSTISSYTKNKKDQFSLHWKILAIAFVILSLDEVAALHEMTVESLRILFKAKGFFYFAWVILAIQIIIILALVFLRLILCLQSKIRFLFMLSATLYIGGGVGMEMVCGRYTELHGSTNFTYALLANVEESLEMAALVIFIHALFLVIEPLKTKENNAYSSPKSL